MVLRRGTCEQSHRTGVTQGRKPEATVTAPRQVQEWSQEQLTALGTRETEGTGESRAGTWLSQRPAEAHGGPGPSPLF